MIFAVTGAIDRPHTWYIYCAALQTYEFNQSVQCAVEHHNIIVGCDFDILPDDWPKHFSHAHDAVHSTESRTIPRGRNCDRASLRTKAKRGSRCS